MTADALDIAELLEQWNNHSTPESTSTVPALFAAQCAATPDAVAVVAGERRLTYRELGDRVAQLAGALHTVDARPEARIAVGLPRSAEMVVAVLAAMTAGAAFVPVDPAWPALRRRQVLADAGVTAAFVTADDDSDWFTTTLTVDLDSWGYPGSVEAGTQPAGAQLAYVIFTSGSTGKPKGAMIRHEAIAERLVWQRDQILRFGADDAALFKAPLSFDISVNEILLPLISGGRVVVADPGGEKDPEYLLDLIASQRVTFVYLVSSMLDTLLELDRAGIAEGRPTALGSLRHVWCGGEVLTPGLFARFRDQLSTTLYHGYGPAEATIGVSHVIYRNSAERIATSIGRPNPHTQLYVLDDDLQPAPPGVGGELYAAGFLLGRGYVNAAALTASRFVANPFDTGGSRMYRTGDRARWTEDGSLEFLGRTDNQVKIRGRRVELEEIESALADHPAIRQAVVDVHRHGGTEQLVGYLVTAAEVRDADLTDWCRTRLPDYMVPTTFMMLERIPLTDNGKADRRALPAPQITRTLNPPHTPRQAMLCQAFSDALGLQAIGVDEDFFALGGDSIVAIRVVSRVRAQGYGLSPRDMFTHRTVETLAPLLTASAAPGVVPLDPTGPAAPTPILCWLAEAGADGSVLDGFYQGVSLVAPADLDEDALRAALRATLARHHLLWAHADSPAHLRIPASAPEPLLFIGATTDGIDAMRDRLVAALDPTAGVMVAFGWLRGDSGPGRLLILAHHVVVDGVSLRILAEDTAAAHALTAAGRPTVLPDTETSWRTWAQRLRDAATGGVFDADLPYWRRASATPGQLWEGQVLDPGRDVVGTERRLTVELSADVTEAVLSAVPDRIHGHVNDALVAALYLAVRRWRADRGHDAGALLLELEGHGREGQQVGDLDLSGTVGWFTTLYPVVLDDDDFDWQAALSGGSALGAAVSSIKDQLREVPRHGLSYGALRYLRGSADATLVAAPQVLFNYLGRFDTARRDWSFADDHTVLEDRDPAMPLPRLLEVNAETVGGVDGAVLRATFSWPAGAADEADVAALARRWAELLTAIAASPEVAGHSPSDFAHLTLTNDDVARLETAYPRLTDVLPLTPAQQGIYFHSTYTARRDPYVVQQIVDITGPLDTDRFQHATETVAARHRALSAAFTTLSDGTPVAVHTTGIAPDFEVVDGGAEDSAASVARLAERDRRRRFDLAAPPLTRYTLVRRSAEAHTMIQTVHHIVADGWSVPIVLDDLLTAYSGTDFDGPAPQFTRFVDWLGDRDEAADRAAWEPALTGISSPTRIAAADGTGERATGFGRRTGTLADRAALTAAAGQAAVTVGTLLHTAWGITLGRLTGTDDVVFGTVVSGRGGAVDGIDTMVGLLVNTVPVRVRWSPADTAATVAARVAGAESAVMDHHHLPLTEAHRIAGVDPLFDTLLVIENLGATAHAASGLTLGDVDVVEAPHYPLTVMVAVGDTVTVTVTNDREQVSDVFADTVTAAFTDILSAVTAQPTVRGAAVALSRAVPQAAAPTAGTVTALLVDAVAAHPDHTALATGAGRFTFAELGARAAELAHALVRAGVHRGDVVAVAMSRSADLVAAMWAIIWAGAAYLPVDPTYPRPRIDFMLGHARPRAIVVDDTGRIAVADGVPDGTTVVEVGDCQDLGSFEPVAVGPLDAVSVLYTSGSTGEPKAVVGTHGALANRLTWAVADWPADVRLAKSSLSFVDGTTELLAGLVAGACTVLADDGATRDGRALARLIADHRVGQLVAVPSLAAALAEEHPVEVARVRRWILSGEPLAPAHIAALRTACPDTTIVNSYGSSEVAGDVLTGEQHATPITLGSPVPGAGLRILDTALADLPHGVIGEIYISGTQLARGYLHRPGQTAARFVAAPDGQRMYRTGDLGARLPDGTVVFAGRADEQLKVNGHRVEPGEVEAALTARPEVREAAVIGTGSALAAFLVAEPVDAAELLAVLADALPRHLVPAVVTVIDAIPLLPNGKRDTEALRSLTTPAPADPVAPLAAADDVQRAIVDIMAAVLGCDTVGADADFFALGGDSIAAIRLTSRLARAGYVLTTEDVFRRRTAVGLAELVHTTPGAVTTAEVPRYGTVRLSATAIGRIGLQAEDIWAMSPLQQGVYYQSTLDEAGATYVAQNTFDFDRRIDIDAMRGAFAALLARHPQLRVGFRTIEDGDTTALVQVVATEVPADITVVDLSGEPSPAETAAQIAAADRTAPFDVAEPPLLRMTLLRLPDGHDRMLLTYHFLLFDGWSRELVLRELFALYASGGSHGAVEPHRDVVLGYLNWLQTTGETVASQAWAQLLAGVSEPTLATGVAPGHPDAGPGSEPGRIVVTVPGGLTEQLATTANELGVTLNSVLTTALAMVTGYQAGSTDVVIGTTVAGRPGELVGIDETIGLFLNTVPVRVDASPARSAAATIRAVDEQRISMMRHDHLGLGQIQRAAGDSAVALFDSLLVLQNFLDDDTFTDLESAHGIVGVDYYDSTHFPLTWVLTPGRELTVKLEYRVIDDERAREMVSQLVAALQSIATNPERALGSADLVGTERRSTLQRRWAQTQRPVEDITIAELLARQADRDPAAAALVFGDQRLSFRELDDRVNQLARYLRSRGAGPETFVALALPRSIEMVVALFAVLRTGAGYLPLELDLPIERLRTILNDARPVLLLAGDTRAELSDHARSRGTAVITVTDPGIAATAAQRLTAAELAGFTGAQRLAHPAYLIYTSGSTGRPKGVLTGYAGLTNMFFNHREAIFAPTVERVAATGRDHLHIAHTVSFSFDMSWEELFWLVEGHTVHICDEELRRDAPALVGYCREHAIDVINVTPTYAHHLLDAGLLDDGGHIPALVLLGGEAVGEQVWSRLREHPGTAGYNLYGPTEYTINTLGAGTDDRATATVGQPIWNTRAYILDAALRPVPDGAVGELYIAGVGLARGYHHRAGLTATAMVADPYLAGGRMYRTGDLVRRRPGGDLDFLGRADDQVKIRGYRVELGEVESVLVEAAGVVRCAVVVRPGTGTPPVKTLAAYVIARQQPRDTPEFVAALRDHLAARLPAYMVPARYGIVDHLPLTINGKLDTAALPEPVPASTGGRRAPRTPAEAVLLDIVAAVLGLDGAIGVDDDFFALGGDSISSIAVSGRARKAGLHVTPRDIFRRRTVAAVAAAAPSTTVAAVTDSGVGPIVATPMLAETVTAATPLDNFYQSMVLTTPLGISAEQLRAMLGALLDAHPMLRARLEVADGGWTLTVPPPDEAPAPTLAVERNPLSSNGIAAAVARVAARLAPQDGIMMRAVWHDIAGQAGHLLIVIHHLVVDGVSWRILAEDLALAWDDISAGRAVSLTEPPTSFRTWACALAGTDFTQEADHWNAVLATPDPQLGVRAPEPVRDTASTVVSHSFSLPAPVSAALLSAVPAAFHGGVNDVLLSTLALALARWRAARGQADATAAVLNLEGHGREAELVAEHLDLSRTIGWFTAIYPVRVDPGTLSWDEVLAAGPALAAAVKSVKEQLRAVPNRGLGYGVLRHLDRGAPISGAAPQILFNYLGRFTGGTGHDWVPVAEIGALREGVDPTNPAVALEINALAEDRPDGTVLTATLAWPAGLAAEAEMRELAELWAEAITALTRCTALHGHTPSDFPLITLTQADIDGWERDAPVLDVLPLLPLQEGMYFHSAFGDGVDTYRVQQIAELTGPVEPEALHAAAHAVLHRHQALRASFRELADGRVAQVIWADVPVEFDAVTAGTGRWDDIAAKHLSRPFDLSEPPLVRYTLVSLSPGEHRLIQTLHHIVADGWSYPLIFGDIVEHYNAALGAGPAPAPLAVTLRDHIEAVNAAGSHGTAAWAVALADVDPTLLFPDTTVGEHRSVTRRLSRQLTEALSRSARDRGLTLSTVLHGAWGVLLGALTGRRRITFGSTVSGRAGTLTGTESIVGLLINTVPVPMSWNHATPLATVFDDLQQQQSSLLDAQHVGLGELARLAGVREFFDTLVVVENFPTTSDESPSHPKALSYHGFTGTDAPHYPLALVAYLGDELTLEIKYDTAALTSAHAERFAERTETVLAAFADRPDQPVGALDLRTDAERHRTAAGTPRRGPDRTLADAFAAVVRRAPDAVAVGCGPDRLSYAELDARASAVAAALIGAGVRPETRVAVAMPRSLDLIVALLAVVKAGGTYVPLDIDSPEARLRHILDDAAPVCVLTDRADRIPAAVAPVLIVGDAARYRGDAVLAPDAVHTDQAAYVIYTSGSTGVPKGVAVTHRNVVALFDGAARHFDVGAGDVWTMFHSVAFDFSVWELWGALLHGGRLVVVEPDVARDPDRFVRLLADERVTVLNQTPSAFYPLIEADRRLRPPLALRYVVFGGEALDTARLSGWYDRHDSDSPQLVNMYGITETCVHVTYRPLGPADTEGASVIGGALPGLGVHLLDRWLRPVPAGVAGEMYIAGGQLARGYVGRAGLTASRFIANPFDGSGERLYRSGDTAMWTEDGELVYLGRSDHQVKVRGYRVELGEVEGALAALPGIANAAAAVHTDDAGRTRLVGYLVGSGDVAEVRAGLAQRIPDYMVPSTFIVLDALPLTVNGKLDRAALPAPADHVAEAVPAGGTTAGLLAGLCTEILGSTVGIDDDFFAVGGDSIVAIQLVNRARREGVRITPQQVFVCRTPAALARAAQAQAHPAVPEDTGPDLGEVLPTPIVQRLAELGGSISRLNQAELVRTPAGASPARLQAAVDAVVARHDALRLRLHRPAPMLWSLEVTARSAVSLRRVDAVGLSDDALRDAIGVESDAAADRLDADAGVIVQAVWFDRGDQQGRLLLVVHHLAIDAVSWPILLEDLRAAYDRTPLAPVSTSIRAHARMVSETAQGSARLAEFEHWAATLAPGAELDPQASTVGLTTGATRDHEVRLSAQETAPLLTSVPAMANADVTDTLVTALYLAVARWRDGHGRPLALDLERHGRDHWGDDVDLSRTIGWFTTIAPVRLAASSPDLVVALGEIKEQLRAAPDGGHGFGQLRYCNARTAAALGRLPGPQLLFNYLGRWSIEDDTDWASAPEADALRVTPDPDLGIPYLLEINTFCAELADGPELRAVLTYADGGLSTEAVTELGEHFAAVLRELGRAATGTSAVRLTPSDLPLVELSQGDIDRVAATAPDRVETIWPLSPLQEGVYFQARYADAAVYVVQNVFDIAERIDLPALCAAYSAVMRRNPVLRSGFHADELPRPVAAIATDPVCEPELVDLGGLRPEQIEARLAELTAADRLRTFDLGVPPLARFTVVRTAQRDRLIFSYHFLLLDGWSREQLLRELFTEYAAAVRGVPAELPTPAAGFTDYLHWLDDQDRGASARCWAQALAGLAAPTLLVPAAVGTEPTLALRLDFTLTEEQTAALTRTARDGGVTLNAVISTALALVLGYETGSQDVVFGSTVAGRPTDLDGIESVIGLFLNTVPTRVRLAPGRSVADTARAVQSERLDLMDHEYLGLGDIQRAAGASGPLFDSLYVLQNFLDDDTFSDLETEHGIVGHDSVDASHYPLTWVASPGRRLWVKLEYRPDVVDRGHAQRLLDRLRQVLTHCSGQYDAALATVPLVLPGEQAGLAARANSTRHPLPAVTVTDLLAEHRERDLPALVCGADRVSYRELDERITRLAWLLHEHGAGRECTVALAIPRSVDAVVALFAVLRAGAAYLPLELDYPDERLATMLGDARPVCLVTTAAVTDRISPLAGTTTLIVLDGTELPAAPPDWPGGQPTLDDPAYLIYTSGSTGAPKGVVTAHRGLTNMHLNHRAAIFEPAIARAGGRRLRIAHTVSFSFDMSWEELLWLIEGHEVHICDEELRRDATALVDYCHKHEIDVVNVTPTYAGLLFEQGLLDPGGHPPVLVLLGGEAVSVAVWDRLRDSDTSYGYNLYGPTEYTINTLGGGTGDSATPTVGQPIWNTRVYILDPWLRPVPDGMAGELYIAGAGLARGYLGRPGLSADRFVADPFEPGRMYRTGDVVARRPDGNVEFLGRSDDQVKIRGYRVEPAEVQAVLATHPRVRHAAVIARPDPATSGSHRLVGYVVTGGSEDGSTDAIEIVAQLRTHLKAALPAYMVPSSIAVINEIPLTDNGKLDVRALPDVAPRGPDTTGRAPQSATEETLCGLFAEVLGVERVGVDDDFFDLGGHSLLSIRLLNRVRTVLSATVSLRDVFDTPTVGELAARLDTRTAESVRPPLVAADRPPHIPVSPAQERLLILDRLGGTGAAYNYPLVFRVSGAMDLDALRGAVNAVVDRHESLRTVFIESDGTLYQRILPAGTAVPVRIVDCPADDLDESIAALVEYRFDLAAEIPVRVTVLRSDPEDCTIVVLLHHITTDEWSDAPFLTDLNRAYRDGGTPLPPLEVHYADYTLWHRQLVAGVEADQRSFWARTLAGAPDELALPTDRPRPARPSGAGGTVHVTVPTETVAALRNLAADRHMSMVMVLHAGLAVLLHRLGGGTDIVVGTPVAGRDEAVLNEVIGFFVNTVVLRTDVSGNPDFDELLARVRDADLAAFAHQDLPFERLVEDLNPPRVTGRNPLFNVFLGYHLRDGAPTEMLGLPTRWYEPPATAAMFDLGFTLIDERGGAGTIMAEYSADLFDEATVRGLAHRLVAVLDRAAANSTAAIGAIAVLDDDERADLVHGRNDTGHDVVPDTLATLVSRQARRTPDAVAIAGEDAQLSYAELDSWSDRLAAKIIDDGAGVGATVGVALPRSMELVVALLAVAKSGAAFLPLDADYPAERVQYMVEDARPAVVLDDPEIVRAAQERPSSAALPEVPPAAWGYVLYTSGSTGRPKGVAVPHAGIVNRIAWLQHAYPLDGTDRMLVKTPISFDTSVWEVFWPLSVGATLVLARPGGHRDPGYLAETIVAQGVTAVDFVPSMLELFLDDPRSAHCPSLTRVTVGGEALGSELAARCADAVDVPLHNLYGPTETSVDVLGWTFDGGAPALGVPGWNVRAYVLDDYLDPVPAGVPGELYVAGVQLADGYLHRHALTAQRFVASPFDPGQRMYRTGDLVRWRGDGQLEYLGRTDDQIKLRGVRIEPGEIEAVLSAHPGVASARVVVRADRLVAYYLPGGAVDPRALRERAASALPTHMVPAAFVEVEAFPLTPSGKLDRGALPPPEFAAATGRPPVSPPQRRLCELFSEVLGVDVTTVDADFFTLGGHSLLLVRLAGAIRREFGLDIPVAELMAAPTVADVAERLAGNTGSDSLAPVLALRASGTQPPLFCLHPAGGLSWQFAGLKPYLPPQIPIYGLQSPVFSGARRPETIRQLADDYADTVAALAPSGPIRLLGWSFGGSLALLVARELRSRGRQVGFVGMLDARTDNAAQGPFDETAVLARLLREMGFPVEPGTRMTVGEAVELVRASGDAIAVLDDTQIARVIENYVAAERFTIGADYGRYEGDVFFVDATVPEPGLTGVASRDWHTHVAGELRVVALDCRHSELLDPAVLKWLGPLIAAELQR
ncbi:non-ribosomal peptide synthetase [Mycolicibacterium sp. CH28]|uniref:non-ribosomal peptide synthase/polyketide synthase n=1 Tax=Mycolicibacterium sp. CH28 TaxID=2512237 RepID=UPI0010818847|nr:non-ribosomal peptide synthetase [Mycolicibacterium sp. CH28]TGD89793.1 non-ribosomal peptide synthetase [Mycolicibacterium sp. CH28]